MKKTIVNKTPAPVAAGTRVRLGSYELEFGRHIEELADSSAQAADSGTLRQRLKTDGYLFLRGFVPRGRVMAARHEILSLLNGVGCLTHGVPLDVGLIGLEPGRRRVPSDPATATTLCYDVQHRSQSVLFRPVAEPPRFSHFEALVKTPRLLEFFGLLAGGQVETRYHQAVPQAVPTGEFTGVHCDSVYFGPPGDHLLTCWMPLGDIPLELGPVALLREGPECARVHETYGRMVVARDRIEPWFSTNALEMVETFGGRWLTANFLMGDLLIYGMHTLHAALTNQTPRYRLSADTRYQLVARREPEARAAAVDSTQPEKSMAQARAEWGL